MRALWRREAVARARGGLRHLLQVQSAPRGSSESLRSRSAQCCDPRRLLRKMRAKLASLKPRKAAVVRCWSADLQRESLIVRAHTVSRY